MEDSKNPQTKAEESVRPDMKMIAAPKPGKFQTPSQEKLDLFFDKFLTRVSFIEKQVSKQTFYLTHLGLLIFGLVFCLVVAYVVNDNSFFPKTLSKDILNETVTKKHSSFNLVISSPEDSYLSFQNTAVIAGKTSPKATIVISSNSQDIVVQANNSGNFSQIVNLEPGQNDLMISSFDFQGNTKTEPLAVYYSEEKI